MYSVRPAPSPNYLHRPRLLERLPDAPGFVAWLEAPYGYGKSVLAGQWAGQLEQDGWRVVWLSLAGEDARPALAGHLGLPAMAPWGVVNDELLRVKTLVVLEELMGTEAMGQLLGAAPGLVLLASRQHLPYPELPKLRTSGRLVHLTSADLAFEEAEAVELFLDEQRGRQAWQLTKGWSLPLHFAALTGDLPQHASLLQGVRRSVSERGWRELLFLSSVDFLPHKAAAPATGDLVRSGFLQALADGYRLHPLMAESVRNLHLAEVRTELGEQASRLEALRRGEAFERAGHLAGLQELLASGEGALYQAAPETFLRWHDLVQGGHDAARRAYAAMARLHLNRFEDGLPDARELLGAHELAPELRAALAGVAVVSLGAAKRFEEAKPFIAAAHALLADVPPQDAGQLLQNLGILAFAGGDFGETERLFRASLKTFAAAPPTLRRSLAELKVRANLYLMAWELRGDPVEPLVGQRELAKTPDLDDTSFSTLHQNMAVSYALTLDDAAGVASLRLAAARAGPYGRIVIGSIQAYLERDLAAFPALLGAARKWETFELCERVSALWLRTLRRMGDLESGEELRPLLELGPFTKLELTWLLVHRGDHAAARALLEETKAAYSYREYRVHWHAAAYMVERTEQRLEELLALTTTGASMLVYAGVPLAALPRERPELAAPYPLDEVLASGWQEAIALRQGEIPPLEIGLLGEVSATRLGQAVALTDRQRELLTLLAMGVPRDNVAEEIWPETDAKKQRNNLGVQLNLLRKALEPWGVSTYVTESGLTRHNSDLGALRVALLAADAGRVLELYRGPLAPGVELEAVAEERYALHERVVELLHSAALEDGTPPDTAVGYLKRVLELEPLHEEALRALLGLLVGLGRNREAQRRYQRFAERLLEETGMEPLPETTTLVPA